MALSVAMQLHNAQYYDKIIMPSDAGISLGSLENSLPVLTKVGFLSGRLFYLTVRGALWRWENMDEHDG